jgi:hypothetical protein
LLVLLGGVRHARAQSADALYEAGAYRIAADSFAARAAKQPGVPAHWYNLGNALYRVGDGAGARAAWVHAARLAPRNGTIRQALMLVPAPDANSANATRVTIVTPGEVLSGAILLWMVGWILVALGRPFRYTLPLLLVAAIAGSLGASKAHEYAQPIALVRHPNTSLRAAPYLSATARRGMNEGTTVVVLRTYAGWVLVRRGNDRGWMQASDIVRVAG